jgi:cytochrome c-type protein NapB
VRREVGEDLMKKENIFIKLHFVLGLSFLLFVSGFSSSRADDSRNSRANLRAFYTSPPVIPHEIDERDSEVCLSCHIDVFDFGDSVTVKTPHPDLTNCLQCHVPMISQLGEIGEEVLSSWSGLEEPQKIKRAHAFAPPAVPHRQFLREDCLSCHHPDSSREYLRTPHPERVNCLQCHVADQGAQF